MSERLPLKQSELDWPSEVFDTIASLRARAQAQRIAYRESVKEMNELCEQLRGVDLLLTGRLEGRGGTRVYDNDPLSQVERLAVRVGSASMETYEGGGEPITRNLPYLGIVAWSIEANELIVAKLGIGDFGVTAETLDGDPIQV